MPLRLIWLEGVGDRAWKFRRLGNLSLLFGWKSWEFERVWDGELRGPTLTDLLSEESLLIRETWREFDAKRRKCPQLGVLLNARPASSAVAGNKRAKNPIPLLIHARRNPLPR